MYRVLFVGAACLVGATGAQADCAASFRFVFGQTTSGSMATSSGTPCPATAGRTGSNTVIKTVKVTVPPNNGTASAHAHGVTYRSKPGFKGDDAFTFTIFGDGNAGRNTTATIQMGVNVR